MKKFVGVIVSMTLCTQAIGLQGAVTDANEISSQWDQIVIANSEKSTNVVEEKAEVQENGGVEERSVQSETLDVGEAYREDGLEGNLTREAFLSYFIGSKGETTYSHYLEKDKVTRQQVAYILCDYIGESPVYLPSKEQVSSPYIGKLILKGIWSGDTTSNEVLSVEEWEVLWARVNDYLLQKEKGVDVLSHLPEDLVKKYKNYEKSIENNKIFTTLPIGTVSESSNVLRWEQASYPLYYLGDTQYVKLSTLRAMGFSQEVTVGSIYLRSQSALTPSSVAPGTLSEQVVHMSQKAVYIDEARVRAFTAGGETFVPVRMLENYFTFTVETGMISLTPTDDPRVDYLGYKNEKLTNLSKEDLVVSYTQLFWNGTELVEKIKKTVTLYPGEYLTDVEELCLLDNRKYITTLITSIETSESVMLNRYQEWQKDTTVLATYEKAILQEEEKKKTSVFPETPVMATVTKSIRGLNVGEKVELYTENGSVYSVITSSGSKISVPSSYLSIPNSPKSNKSTPTKEQIEGFINTQNKSSETEYLMWTDLYRQHTYVFKGSQNNWQLIRNMKCSTGENLTPTPRGTFSLLHRVPYFGIEKGYRCKNAFSFIGTVYLYHSVLFDVTGSRIISGLSQLGERASHGCIRLTPEDSLWVYETMKTGTTVWIR